MLNLLSLEQKELKKTIKKEYVDNLTSSQNIEEAKLIALVKYIYAKIKKPMPRVFIAADPATAVKMAQKMGCKTVKTVHYFGAGYDSGWISFYDFFYRIGILKKSAEKFLSFKNIVDCGAFAFIFMDKAVIAVRRPLYVKRNDKKQMHCTTGPAIEFPGGRFKSYRLNKIKVPEKLILHPEKITKDDILGEKNVDVRREMIRHIGMDRFVYLTNPKVLDKSGDYELLSIDLSDELKDCRYLKMKNPSINVWHVEGVERECTTVQEALNWRAGNIHVPWNPEQLS